ncbi:integumentary mucin A.1-like [Amyelois transitella]|uniref:integumentary mucin A.1-like n=1 Tax=Amyelois transitella TaxID=680683 RepID=UPI00298FA1E9|nr:integumentary mucin A.1-like [Amyelois transitella]
MKNPKICPALIHLTMIIVCLTPATRTSAVGCKIACRKCRDMSEHASLVAVYCEMCEECKLKKALRQRLGESTAAPPYREVVEVEDVADCPSPPPCSGETAGQSVPYKTTTIATTTTTITTTTTTTTTHRPCQHQPICVVKKTQQCPPSPNSPQCSYPAYQPCVPSGPACPMVMPIFLPPGFYSSPSASDGRLNDTITRASTIPTTAPSNQTTLAYLSLFVGIPKELQVNQLLGDEEDTIVDGLEEQVGGAHEGGKEEDV